MILEDNEEKKPLDWVYQGHGLIPEIMSNGYVAVFDPNISISDLMENLKLPTYFRSALYEETIDEFGSIAYKQPIKIEYIDPR